MVNNFSVLNETIYFMPFNFILHKRKIMIIIIKMYVLKKKKRQNVLNGDQCRQFHCIPVSCVSSNFISYYYVRLSNALIIESENNNNNSINTNEHLIMSFLSTYLLIKCLFYFSIKLLVMTL